jgi:hypothetical protein
VTGASISNFTITRPQTQDSNNEIIRGDHSSFITIDSIRVVNSASRAPIINLQFGNRNSVTRSSIYDYQVIRSETSAEKPGNHLQVFGSGITFTEESNINIADCKVVQNVVLSVGTPTVGGWYQASAYQVILCDTGRVAGNYVYRTGQGIDTGLSTGLSIYDNFIEQCHIAGIKMVNGSNKMTVEDNYVTTCGITGIWLSVGNTGLGGSYECIVRNNTLVSIGKGIGLDFWDGGFNNSVPAAIHLQVAKLASDRVRSNIVRSNRSYDNDEQLDIVVAEPASASFPFAAAGNTIIDNEAVVDAATLG